MSGSTFPPETRHAPGRFSSVLVYQGRTPARQGPQGRRPMMAVGIHWSLTFADWARAGTLALPADR